MVSHENNGFGGCGTQCCILWGVYGRVLRWDSELNPKILVGRLVSFGDKPSLAI